MIPPAHGESVTLGIRKTSAELEMNLNNSEVNATTSDSEGDKAHVESGIVGGTCKDLNLRMCPSTTDFSTHFVIRRHPQSQSSQDDKTPPMTEDNDDNTSTSGSRGAITAIANAISVVPIADAQEKASGVICTPQVDDEGCEAVKIESCLSPPTPVTPPTPLGRVRTTPRFQHPFMKSQFSARIVIPKAEPPQKSYLATLKMPCSPMDSCYEPISAFCIQEIGGPKLTEVDEHESFGLSSPDNLVGNCSSRSPMAETLKACEQRSPIPLSVIFNELRNLKKIGEGVYGEVYAGSFRCLQEFDWVYKIVAIEGEATVNGERQRKSMEILPEIIVTQKLNQLRTGYNNCQTSGFVHMRNARIATGKYPSRLIKCWEKFNDEYESDNDTPEFPESQLYMVLEFEFAGKDIETIIFKDARQSISLILQVAHILAVGECALEFEHRDLHWGNVMVESCTSSDIPFVLNGETLLVPSLGIKVVVIDFTIARLKDAKSSVICLDLHDDDEQFLGTGDHQFDIYRMMRDLNRNDWQKYFPKSNIFWLHYLANKFSVKASYSHRTNDGEGDKRDKNRSLYHRKAIEMLINFSHYIVEYQSAMDFVQSGECEKCKKFLMSTI